MPRRSIVLAAAMLIACACTRSAAPPPSPKVAYFEDTTVETSSYLVTPSFQGMRLAFLQAEVATGLDVELVPFDTKGDPATALRIADQVSADPTYVAVIVAPFWEEPSAVGAVLQDHGLVTLSLSALGPPAASSGWMRLVPTERQQAATLNGALRTMVPTSRPLCVAGDGTAPLALGDMSSGYAEVVPVSPITDATGLAEAVSTIQRSRCGVAWTGYSGGAEDLQIALAAAGVDRTPFVGTDALKTETFLSRAGSLGEGTVIACPCADISASSDPRAQRFIHDYQSEFNNPPWPYAAEGFDAAGMVLRALGSGSSRTAVLHALDPARPYEGVARTYRFDGLGELADPSVGLFRDEGERWVPESPTLITPHTLAFGSCVGGPPFAYAVHGSPRGFDVELGRTIASQLHLSLDWKGCQHSSALGTSVDALLAPEVQRNPEPIALTVRAVTVVRRGAGGDLRCERTGRTCLDGIVESRFTREPLPVALVPVGHAQVNYRSPRRAYDDLERGRLDSLVDVEFRAWAEVERRTDLRVSRARSETTFAFRSFDPLVEQELNDALRALLADGTYARLFAKYFPGARLPANIGS